MSDFDRNIAARGGYAADRVAAIDAGLRAYMIRVYNYMAAGIAFTGVTAWATYQAAGGDAIRVAAGRVSGLTPFGAMVFNGVTPIVLMLVTLGLVFFISFRIHRLQPTTAFTLFSVYAALMGVALSSIFLAYTGVSITRVFFITAATFGAMSLWGYTTQRDLSGMGSFLMMGLIGLIIASVVNIFLASSALQFIISAVGVLVFVGLTAYDTQQIKEMYDVQDDGTVGSRKAIMGALRLYLDFLNLFIMLLQLVGDRR
ncbi:MAG: Bax inhibitor-1/YccA family protein [Pseudolabrys sp.]|nr:Bax inhibitor-1/YccA family protein [Pseudolabrys sp.]MBV9956631.1 Bax inhibitor-1/YccA family protein [Pseudolabrys sp.]